MADIIRVAELNLKINSSFIIQKLSIELQAGSFNTVVGPSGAGKTQFLNTLAGLNTAFTPSPVAYLSVSYVFQNSRLFPWLSIYDNLRITTKKTPEAIRAWLKKVNLQDYADHFPHQLSMGMQQKINVIRAFLNSSDVILMDEPFSSLDYANRHQLQQELLHLWQETKPTIIFVTHDIAECLTLSQQVFLFSKKQKRIIDNFSHDKNQSKFSAPYREAYERIENFLLAEFKE